MARSIRANTNHSIFHNHHMKPEQKIEKAVSLVAENDGWLSIKFSPMGDCGWPDRIFIKDGRTVWIEFKAPGGEPRALQRYRIELLKRNGAEVHVVDDIDEGVAILRGG